MSTPKDTNKLLLCDALAHKESKQGYGRTYVLMANDVVLGSKKKKYIGPGTGKAAFLQKLMMQMSAYANAIDDDEKTGLICGLINEHNNIGNFVRYNDVTDEFVLAKRDDVYATVRVMMYNSIRESKKRLYKQL